MLDAGAANSLKDIGVVDVVVVVDLTATNPSVHTHTLFLPSVSISLLRESIREKERESVCVFFEYKYSLATL